MCVREWGEREQGRAWRRSRRRARRAQQRAHLYAVARLAGGNRAALLAAQVEVREVDLRRRAHEAVGREGEQALADGERDGAAGFVHANLVQLLARGQVPNAHGLVGRAGDEVAGVHRHLARPDGAIVALVGADALAIVGVPEARLQVFGAAHEQIALAVEFDLGQGALVPLEQVWPHGVLLLCC